MFLRLPRHEHASGTSTKQPHSGVGSSRNVRPHCSYASIFGLFHDLTKVLELFCPDFTITELRETRVDLRYQEAGISSRKN